MNGADAHALGQLGQLDPLFQLPTDAYVRKDVAPAPAAPDCPDQAEPSAKTQLHPHLYKALQAAGRIRSARLTGCTSCGTETVTGLDDDVLARQVTCDPTPTTAVGEALAAATGRPTYTLTIRDRRVYLDYRDKWRITGHPAGTVDVVAEHCCHRPLPDAEPANPRHRRRPDLPNTPPY